MSDAQDHSLLAGDDHEILRKADIAADDNENDTDIEDDGGSPASASASASGSVASGSGAAKATSAAGTAGKGAGAEQAGSKDLEAESIAKASDESSLSIGVGVDDRSVFVNNVDYSVTPAQLEAHFNSCGMVNRVTILCDKFTGHPKGCAGRAFACSRASRGTHRVPCRCPRHAFSRRRYAYIEFDDAQAAKQALLMDKSILQGRELSVRSQRRQPAPARSHSLTPCAACVPLCCRCRRSATICQA